VRYAAWLFHERHSKIGAGAAGVAGGDYEAIKEAANQRSRSISESARDIAAEGWVHEAVNPDRKALACTSFRGFCESYFQATFHLPWSDDHLKGVFVLEDDCVPLAGANEIVRRVQTTAAALPGVEVIACHKPKSRYTFSEQAGCAVRIIKPPWGSILTWYNPLGLRRAHDFLAHMEIPTDWLWRDLASHGKFAMLVPPVATHDGGTTYIGNEHRGLERAFIP